MAISGTCSNCGHDASEHQERVDQEPTCNHIDDDGALCDCAGFPTQEGFRR